MDLTLLSLSAKVFEFEFSLSLFLLFVCVCARARARVCVCADFVTQTAVQLKETSYFTNVTLLHFIYLVLYWHILFSSSSLSVSVSLFSSASLLRLVTVKLTVPQVGGDCGTSSTAQSDDTSVYSLR